jgi:hypothetical protein
MHLHLLGAAEQLKAAARCDADAALHIPVPVAFHEHEVNDLHVISSGAFVLHRFSM